jgi:endoglucanase
VLALLIVLAVAAGISALSLRGGRFSEIPTVSGTAPTSAVGHARFDAKAFLTRYLGPDGRVVRRDQGGDTVSEGQAYAMLLAVAVGSERQFDQAWQWERAMLQRPDGLFSYHWADGAVVGRDPATDADLDTAWALVLAGHRFRNLSYGAQAKRIADAVVAQETVNAGGRLQLVAGPWGRTSPFAVDPSYFAPEAMAALATVTGDSRWKQLEANSIDVVARLQGGPPGRLPPDWAALDASGAVQPTGAPSGSQGATYGLDAQRAPVWMASACSPAGRSAAAQDWSLLRNASDRGAALAYSLDGVRRSPVVNPLGLVAAAAAADAAGARSQGARLLDRADTQANRYHTYYGDAWVALGRVLLDTAWLSPCPPAAGG